MKTGHWVLIALALWALGFAGGYKLSSSSGIQPGYFEAAEAGGYGSAEVTIEGISNEVQDYYKNLYKEEQ
ncbi:MAG: hypothetical protein A2010_12655 [Nitrospirae bacterium GWD2_57_9]|nr:MAG: hypothetical protein A2010_12655 [Nitrospirae bacterium GWD2_57_9]